MTFGESLYKIRQERKMSQDELAEQVGVSAQTVRRWEYDKTQPSIDQLNALCKIFEVPFDFFLLPDVESDILDGNEIIKDISVAETTSTNNESQPKSHKKRNILIVSIAFCLAYVGLIILSCVLSMQRTEGDMEKVNNFIINWMQLLYAVIILMGIIICIIVLVKFIKSKKEIKK